MRPLLVGGLLAALASSCAPATGPDAKVWTPREFVSGAPKKKDFGGFRADQLISGEGDPLPFRQPPFTDVIVTQGVGHGLTVFPAYSEGKVAAYTISDIWFHHPGPWVQPGYVLVSAANPRNPAAARLAVPTIFGVTPDSTFYSPFWWIHYPVVPADTTKDQFTSVTAVLNARVPMGDGPVSLCPMLPADVKVARAINEPVPHHPFTGVSVGDSRAPATSWVDGKEQLYADFGPDRIDVDDGRPIENSLYVFVAADDPSRILPLPAVLPDDAFRTSFLRRVDVLLPPTAAVFVPDDRPALRDLLANELLAMPPADPAIPAALAHEYELRVALDSACFGDAARFPADCVWLDSQTALEAKLRWRLEKSDTTVAAATLLVGTRTQ